MKNNSKSIIAKQLIYTNKDTFKSEIIEVPNEMYELAKSINKLHGCMDTPMVGEDKKSLVVGVSMGNNHFDSQKHAPNLYKISIEPVNELPMPIDRFSNLRILIMEFGFNNLHVSPRPIFSWSDENQTICSDGLATTISAVTYQIDSSISLVEILIANQNKPIVIVPFSDSITIPSINGKYKIRMWSPKKIVIPKTCEEQ